MFRSKILTPEFFLQDTAIVAKHLIGMELATIVRGVRTSGMITEVEAYLGKGDEACHANRGVTPRNKVMFMSGGHCYVYFIYGNHYCVNVVTEREGVGAAVLIRAIRPITGIETIRRRRGRNKNEHELTNGPGKICQALAIDKKMLQENFLTSEKIFLNPYKTFSDTQIKRSPRIGLSKAKDLELRFFLDC